LANGEQQIGERGPANAAPPVADPAVTLESILGTDEVNRRPSRPPDYEKENRAPVKLAQFSAC